MKKLFTTALLLFAVALVQAAPPQYQVEPEQVQVFVDVPQVDLIQVATVNLITAEVVSSKAYVAQVTAEIVNKDLVAIKMHYGGCQHLYIAKRPDIYEPQPLVEQAQNDTRQSPLYNSNDSKHKQLLQASKYTLLQVPWHSSNTSLKVNYYKARAGNPYS